MRISDWSSDVCSSDLHAKLVGDLFGIKGPAFAIGGDRCRLAIERQLAVLEFQRPFEQMSRRAFVIGEGGKRIARPFGGIAQVDEEDAGARAVGGARLRRPARRADLDLGRRSEEHTSELQSLMRISYAVFCLKKK